MERGVIVGGLLIAASFLGAVLLNRAAREEEAPQVAAPQPHAEPCLLASASASAAEAKAVAAASPCAAAEVPGTVRTGPKAPLE